MRRGIYRNGALIRLDGDVQLEPERCYIRAGGTTSRRRGRVHGYSKLAPAGLNYNFCCANLRRLSAHVRQSWPRIRGALPALPRSRIPALAVLRPAAGN